MVAKEGFGNFVEAFTRSFEPSTFTRSFERARAMGQRRKERTKERTIRRRDEMNREFRAEKRGRETTEAANRQSRLRVMFNKSSGPLSEAHVADNWERMSKLPQNSEAFRSFVAKWREEQEKDQRAIQKRRRDLATASGRTQFRLADQARKQKDSEQKRRDTDLRQRASFGKAFVDLSNELKKRKDPLRLNAAALNKLSTDLISKQYYDARVNAKPQPKEPSVGDVAYEAGLGLRELAPYVFDVAAVYELNGDLGRFRYQRGIDRSLVGYTNALILRAQGAGNILEGTFGRPTWSPD